MSGGQCDWKVLSKDQLLFWSLWFGVPAVILGLSCVTSNALALAVDHAPRVLGLIVAAAFGWWLGARLAKRVGRPATAYRVTAALALALLAWVFIPTLHRRSPATVVSGTRCIASALAAVDASDLEGFNRTSSARGTIAAWQFPTLRMVQPPTRRRGTILGGKGCGRAGGKAQGTHPERPGWVHGVSRRPPPQHDGWPRA